MGGLAALAAGWAHGIARVPFESDTTYLTHGIAVVFLCGLVSVFKGDWRSVGWVARSLVLLGLLGTVIGFVMALSGVSPETAARIESVQPMVAALIQGMATALHTTLVGVVGFLWLSLNAHILGGSDAAG